MPQIGFATDPINLYHPAARVHPAPTTHPAQKSILTPSTQPQKSKPFPAQTTLLKIRITLQSPQNFHAIHGNPQYAQKRMYPKSPPSPQIPNPPPPKQTAGLKHPPKGTSTPPLADIIALEALEQSPQSELMIPHPLIQPFLLPSARSPHPAGSTPRGSAKRQRR